MGNLVPPRMKQTMRFTIFSSFMLLFFPLNSVTYYLYFFHCSSFVFFYNCLSSFQTSHSSLLLFHYFTLLLLTFCIPFSLTLSLALPHYNSLPLSVYLPGSDTISCSLSVSFSSSLSGSPSLSVLLSLFLTLCLFPLSHALPALFSLSLFLPHSLIPLTLSLSDSLSLSAPPSISLFIFLLSHYLLDISI